MRGYRDMGGAGGWMTARPWRNGPPASGAASEDLCMLVRGRVALPPGRHVLRLSAGDYYYAWLNGTRLGQGPAPAAGGVRYYQEYPVEGGRTVTVAVLVCRRAAEDMGWSAGAGQPALWAQFVRGGRVSARCDEDWRCRLCRAWPDGGSFDSRLWPQGWEQPRFRDRGCARLAPARWARCRLSPQPGAGLERVKAEPVRTRAVPGGVLLDFGRVRTGTLHAAAQGRAGEGVTLRFGVELDKAGRVACAREERWILGEGESTLHQRGCRVFQYVEALGPGDGPALRECWAWERHYPMPEGLCALSCPRDGLEDIFARSKSAVRSRSQEGYRGWPDRGLGQSLGDAAITARAQVWLTGRTDLLRQYIREAAAAAPLGVRAGGFALLFPALPLTDWDFTGDRDFLRTCWGAVDEIAGEFSRYQRPDGLLEGLPAGWDGAEEGCTAAVNALWFGFLKMKERGERLLGLPGKGESQRVAAAFLQAFWRWESKLFAGREGDGRCTVEANAGPACFGLTPQVGAEAYERLLLRPGQAWEPFLSYLALRGLGRLGRRRALYRLLTREAGDGPYRPEPGGAVPLIVEELAGLLPDPDMPMGLRFRPRLPAELEEFALQAPLRGQLVWVEQREWRAALTVRPMGGRQDCRRAEAAEKTWQGSRPQA